MKKIFLIFLGAVVLICQPLTVQAKTEFLFGGYIRLAALWNSQQGIPHTLAAFSLRDNVRNANHGRFMMNANNSRFNFTIKGPELWGGRVTGFIEVDFDAQVVNQPGTFDSSFNQAKLRLRHAMFKVDWPDREMLFGQYWSINNEMLPEMTDGSCFCFYGATQLRLPQVRYTQKFTETFNASLALCSSQNGRWGLNVDANNPLEGETSETPMVEAKARFEQDFYGKAAWYGTPRAFYVGLGAGYLRSRSQSFAPLTNTAGAGGVVAAPNWFTLGSNNFFVPASGLAAGATRTFNVPNQRYHDHWLFLIENFTPIIPTVTKNLAGSLALAQQWWIGQGVSAWRLDLPGSDRYYQFTGRTAGVANSFDYNMTFIKRYGGWAQLQYYWTNEIYTNINFGFEKAFGFNNQRDASLAALIPTSNGFVYANPAGFDPINSSWRMGVTQWYRPVAAVKFALQYNYMRTNYFQSTSNTLAGSIPTNANNQVGSRSFSGANHSLMANAWYMF